MFQHTEHDLSENHHIVDVTYTPRLPAVCVCDINKWHASWFKEVTPCGAKSMRPKHYANRCQFRKYLEIQKRLSHIAVTGLLPKVAGATGLEIEH